MKGSASPWQMSTCGLSPLLQRGFAYLKSDMELGHARDLDASGWDMSSEAMTCSRSPWSFPRFSQEGWRPRAWNPTPSSRMPWNETAASVIQDFPQRFGKYSRCFWCFNRPSVSFARKQRVLPFGSFNFLDSCDCSTSWKQNYHYLQLGLLTAPVPNLIL
jgi:hypothetical protein